MVARVSKPGNKAVNSDPRVWRFFKPQTQATMAGPFSFPTGEPLGMIHDCLPWKCIISRDRRRAAFYMPPIKLRMTTILKAGYKTPPYASNQFSYMGVKHQE